MPAYMDKVEMYCSKWVSEDLSNFSKQIKGQLLEVI